VISAVDWVHVAGHVLGISMLCVGVGVMVWLSVVEHFEAKFEKQEQEDREASWESIAETFRDERAQEAFDQLREARDGESTKVNS
jgi:hypothetical protein